MLPPLHPDDWPEELDDLVEAAGWLNVYRTFAHYPALLRALQTLRQHVVVDTSLTRQQSEAVILRAGNHLGSDYEVSHHVSRARLCGMSDDRIIALAGPLAEIEGEDRLFAGAVDELMELHQLSPDYQAGLETETGLRGVMDVISTVGFYTTLAMTLKTFATPVDDAIAKELEVSPLGSQQGTVN